MKQEQQTHWDNYILGKKSIIQGCTVHLTLDFLYQYLYEEKKYLLYLKS